MVRQFYRSLIGADRAAAATAALVFLSAASAVIAVLADLPTAVRAPAVFWFVLVGPGAATARLLNIREPVAWLTVALAASIALGTLTSEVLALTTMWSPTALLYVLAGFAIVLAMLPPLRRPGFEAATAEVQS